jgi:hypothetical protein
MPVQHQLLAFVCICMCQAISFCDAFLVVSPGYGTITKKSATFTTSTTACGGALHALKDDEESSSSSTTIPSRQDFLRQGGAAVLSSSVFCCLPSPQTAYAFDGGVGGLGKTKPMTGVKLFEESSTPIQNAAGVLSAEITSRKGKPILVEFQTPWPLLQSSSGLEARDLRNSESAFLQVIPLVGSSSSSSSSSNGDWKNPKVLKALLIESVLASQGKFGAYGAPIDIKVKAIVNKYVAAAANPLFSVTFTTYTPAMRESERQLWIAPIQIDDDTLVTLVVGTTKARFASQEAVFSKIVASYSAVAAPESSFRRGGSSGSM